MDKKNLKLKSSQVHGDIVMGNKYGIDEEKARELLQEVLGDRTSVSENDLSDEDYKMVAKDLLEAFAPTSLSSLYPTINKETDAAISSIDWESRRIVKINQQDNNLDRPLIKITDLLSLEQKKHLIIGAGGLGKTHTLWHMADQLLASGQALPIFLSLSDFNSLTEVMDFFDKMIPNGGFRQLKQHPEVLFFLDSWSQFSKVESHIPDSELQKLLAILGDVRVIASSRHVTPYDAPFTNWEIQGLSDTTVKNALLLGLPSVNPHKTEQIRELLRFPLMLILYLLHQGESLSKGELLSEFQRNLTHGNPSQADHLLGIMSKAVARVKLIHKSSRIADFDREVSTILTTKDVNEVKEASTQIHQLGTLGYQQNYLHFKPIHDLYLEWLVGVGIVRDWEKLSFLSMQELSTREGITLALESGEKLDVSHLQLIMDDDLIFTSSFIPFITAINAEENKLIKTIRGKIDSLLESGQNYERYRGILAAFASRRPVLLRKCLDTLSDMTAQGFYFHDLEQYLDATWLFTNRAILGEWLSDGKGIEYILAAIRKTGDSCWGDWINDQYIAGKLTIGQAAGTVLACVSTLPVWIKEDLSKLINQREAYHLRSAAKRGMNRELAHWVMEHYAEFAQPGSSNFHHLNLVLVGCGENKLFQKMFDQFDLYPPHVQELLLYAFRDRDEAWMIKFQECYMSTGDPDIFHLLFEKVYAEIPDKVAEEWTTSQDKKVQAHGWRTLAKKHQNAIFPQLIENLPESFHNISYVPTLKALQELNEPPTEMVDELWKRLRGQIQPMLMQDMLYALAKVYPIGIASMVGQLKDDPNFLPDYHLYQFLQLLKEWSQRSGLQVRVKKADEDEDGDFSEYVLLNRLATQAPDHFLADSIKVVDSKRIFDFLVSNIVAGNTELFTLLIRSGGVKLYHPALAFYAMSFPTDQSVTNMFQLFSNCWHTFPEDELLKMLGKINESIDKQDNLFKFFNQMGKHPQGTHQLFHKELLDALFEYPENHVHPYREMAYILTSYSIDGLTDLLELFILGKKQQTLWLIRFIEIKLETKLVNEKGHWI